jgi:uncharacterized glyoxalase superfamily protein PhnB
MLVCRDGASEIDFCKTAFGAAELSRRTGANGDVVHATLSIGNSMIMIHGEFPNLASRAPELDGSSSVVIYLYVEDVDITIDQAVAAGAKVLSPVTNLPWGDRTRADHRFVRARVEHSHSCRKRTGGVISSSLHLPTTQGRSHRLLAIVPIGPFH